MVSTTILLVPNKETPAMGTSIVKTVIERPENGVVFDACIQAQYTVYSINSK